MGIIQAVLMLWSTHPTPTHSSLPTPAKVRFDLTLDGVGLSEPE